MNSRSANTDSVSRTGFTLIELLTVIAIVGILSSILFVTFGGATDGAKRAKTKVQFTQWAAAIEAFRQEYGFYPDFQQITDNVINNEDKSDEFFETLSGRTTEGATLTNTDFGWIAGNTKSIHFCSFGQDDLNEAGLLVDAFANAEIAVLVDLNYDGMIRIGANPTDDYAQDDLPAFNGDRPLSTGDVIRAGVVFYSPGANASPSDIVKSW